MKKIAITLGTILLAASMSATAGRGHGHNYRDTAKVVDVDPIYKTIEISRPEKHCWDEQVTHYQPRRKSYTGTVLGGIIGGVVGNQFGQGRGRDASTVAGTLLGASIGNDISRNRRGGHYTTTTERQCEVETYTEYEEQLVGYRVKYRYKGKVFTTRTKHHPGKRIRVRVGVTPVDDI